MSITIRPQGEAALYAKAGQVIGKAQKAEKEEQIAERRRAEQAARDWELQKMLLNSQQDFAHEQRMRQVQLDTEARSREWELEKMEISSRIDFDRQEKERGRKLDAVINAEAALEKEKDRLPPSQYDAVKFQLSIRRAEAEAGAEVGISPSLLRSTQTSNNVLNKRKILSAWYGNEIANTQSISELEDDLRSQGIDPEALYSGQEMMPTPIPEATEEEAPVYKVGDTINVNNQSYIVTGFDEDGEPLVENTESELERYERLMKEVRQRVSEKPVRKSGPANFSWANRSMSELLR